jgi:hypothetical protein
LLSKSISSKNAKSMKKMQEKNARNKCKRKMQVRNAKKIRFTMQAKK